MKFKYIGPEDSRDLPGVGVVDRGVPFEATGPLAEGLDAQPEFQRVNPPKPKPEQPTSAAEKKE